MKHTGDKSSLGGAIEAPAVTARSCPTRAPYKIEERLMKKLGTFAIGLGLWGASALQWAQAAPPATKLITAPLVSPSSAWTYYGAGTTHTNGVAAWSTTPPEIAALARTLGADRISSTVPLPAGTMSAAQYTQNAFDYVRKPFMFDHLETVVRMAVLVGRRPPRHEMEAPRSIERWNPSANDLDDDTWCAVCQEQVRAGDTSALRPRGAMYHAACWLGRSAESALTAPQLA